MEKTERGNPRKDLTHASIIQTVSSVLTLVGFGTILGAIVGAFFKSWFERQKEIAEKEHELKRIRYGAILILMLTQLDPKNGLQRARQFRQDLKDQKDVEKEIETEFLNGVLFASDDVIKGMAEFIRKPTYTSYIKTATAMRRDLWGKKTSINEQILEVLTEENHEHKSIG